MSLRFRFSKNMRLMDAAQFQAVFTQGQRFIFKPGMFIALPNQLDWARFGQVIAKKKLKSATARNNVKRLQRECFRHIQHQLVGYDIVFVASNAISQLDRLTLRKLSQLSWQNLAKKLTSDKSQP